MTKAALIILGLAALALIPATVPAQDNAAISAADTEAVMRQANVIVLRQKLSDAKAMSQRGDIVNAAKLYQESCTLALQIGTASIPQETLQAVAGLTSTRLALGRDAQSHGDYHEADIEVQQILHAERDLKVSPDADEVQAFKKHNDELIIAYRGHLPDAETLDKVPQLATDRVEAGTLVQDGKVFYEMGKYDQAEIRLEEAIKMDPGNTTASYYLNLIKQDKIERDIVHHNTDTQDRMERVEKQWILPNNSNDRAHLQTDTATLPVPNAYATNELVWTGPGRQAIVAKLDHIRLDNISYDGLPLSEVLKQLSEQCRLRDPDRKGINFLINPNPDLSGLPVAAPAGQGIGGFPGQPGIGANVAPAPNIDPNTGLPITPAAGANGNGEQQDVGSFIVKIPSLTDVRLADVLDAICLVCDHPIRYSIQDFAVVFSSKAPETPQLFMRTFRIDPNTFYSGLENVSSESFGSANNNGGSGGSGGSSGGNSGGGGQNQNNGAVVGVVNAFSGAGSLRNTGNGGGGGGGGGGGNQSGSGSLLQNTGGANGANGNGGGGGGNQQNQGGLAYITTQTSAATPSALARAFFTTLGVNLSAPPGKSVFFNDRLGVLFVKATESDLDTIEKALQVLNQVPPQVHIKSRFIEVSQSDDNELGFDWYLGQFNIGNQVVGTGGSSPSLTVPVSTANPLGAFPGNTAASVVAPSTTDQLLTSGLRDSAPTLATFTGILTDPNFRVALHALSQRTGAETLGEPEITVLSGRQTQMRATSVVTVVVGLNFQQGTSATTTTGTGGGVAP
jgi:hypothetical protein